MQISANEEVAQSKNAAAFSLAEKLYRLLRIMDIAETLRNSLPLLDTLDSRIRESPTKIERSKSKSEFVLRLHFPFSLFEKNKRNFMRFRNLLNPCASETSTKVA